MTLRGAIENEYVTPEALWRQHLLAMDPFSDENRMEWFRSILTPVYYDDGQLHIDTKAGPQVQYAPQELLRDSLAGVNRVPLAFETRLQMEKDVCKRLGKSHPFEDKETLERFKATEEFTRLMSAEALWKKTGIISNASKSDRA